MSTREGILLLLIGPWLALVGSAVVPVVPVVPAWAEVAAQDRASSVVDRELEYRAARTALQHALAARDVTQREYERALEELAGARTGGAPLAPAQRRFHAVSDQLQALDRRVDEQADTLEARRQRYLRILDDRVGNLEAQLVDASPVRARDIRALLAELYDRYDDLDRDHGGLRVELVFEPAYELEDVDGPLEIEQKAELLERKVDDATREIGLIDEQIERLEARYRDQRRRENFEAGLGRFEDIRPPVGAGIGGEGSREVEVGRDTTVAFENLPIPVQIERLRNDRRQLDNYREGLAERAADFRTMLRRIT